MAIGFPVRKYLDDDDIWDEIQDIPDFNNEPSPVEKNDLYRMLGHNLRVTSIKSRSGLKNHDYERTVFLTCADDCNCCDKFNGKLLWPVKLQILERHLNHVTLDKL